MYNAHLVEEDGRAKTVYFGLFMKFIGAEIFLDVGVPL